MRSGEERSYGEATIDNKTEAELREEYPKGTLISVFVDGKWQLAQIMGDVSIKKVDKKFAFVANVHIVPDASTRAKKADQTTGGMVGGLTEIRNDIAEIDEEAAAEVEQDIEGIVADAHEAEIGLADEDLQSEFEGGSNRAIVLNHKPEKAEFDMNLRKDFVDAGKSGVDSEQNANYIVADTTLTEDGSIEYSVAEKKSGETYHRIPQEILVLWRDVEQTENELRNVEAQIKSTIALSMRADLLKRVADAHGQVVLAKNQVPEVGGLSIVGKGAIEKIAAELEVVHGKAKSSIQLLVSDILEQSLSGIDDAGTVETNAEKDARRAKEKEETAPRRNYIADVEESIKKIAGKELRAIDKDEAEALKAAVAQAKEKHATAMAAAKAAKQSPPAPFDEDAFVSDYGVDPVFQERRDVIERREILQVFKNLEDDLRVLTDVQRAEEKNKIKQAFYDALFEERSKLAKKDSATPRNQMENPPHDYLVSIDPESIYGKRTHDAYKAVREEWAKDGQESPQIDLDRKFNFDDFINISYDIGEKDGLLPKIPLNPDTKLPESGFKKIHAELSSLYETIKDSYKHLSLPHEKISRPGRNITIEGVKYDIGDEKKLEAVRRTIFETYLYKYHELNKKLQRLLQAREMSSAVVKKETKSAEKKEKKVGFVNIPEAVLRENLFAKGGRLGQFKEAMRLVYGDVFSKAAGLAPASLEAFKKLLPAKEDEELLKAFAPYGLKDWGEFKAMWDAHMAPRFAEGLRIAADAKFKCKIAKKITWYKQAWAIKGDLAVRIGTTALLVGGAAMLSNAAAVAWLGGTATAWGTAAALGGAGVGGGLRGWLNEKIFGSKEAKAKMQSKMDAVRQEVEIGNKDDVIGELLNEQFGGKETKADYDVVTKSIDLLPQLTAIMAETIREVSAQQSIKEDVKKPEEIKKMSKEDKESYEKEQELRKTLKEMSTEARARYERALLTLEPGDRSDLALRLKLAVGISKVTGNGDELEKKVLAKMTFESKDGAPMEGLKTFFAGMSGKRGIGVAAAAGVTVRAAYMAGGYVAAGAAVGAGGGAVIGHESAHKQDMEKIRESSRGQLIAELKEFKRFFEDYSNLRAQSADLNFDYLSDLRKKLLEFKKILHGDVPQKFAAALFVDKRYDQFGDLAAARLQLYKQIRVAVLDAEGTGILMEGLDAEKKAKEAKDANRMRMVLAKLTEAKTEVRPDAEETVAEKNIEEIQKNLETQSKRWTKNKIWKTVGAAAAMAAVSVGLGLSARELLRPETEGIQGEGQTMSEKVADYVKQMEAVEKPAHVVDVLDSSKTELAGTSAEPMVAEAQSTSVEAEPAEPEAAPTEELPPSNPEWEARMAKQNAFGVLETDKPNLIKSGQGTIHALNRLEAGGRYSVLGDVNTEQWSTEKKAGWDAMQKDFESWKEKQLHEMGYRWVNGKLGGPLSLRAGDEMKLFWDPASGESGEWKARFQHFEYNEDGTIKYETDADGNQILDQENKPIPVDRFKGRVSDHLLFTGNKGGTKNLAEIRPTPEEVAAFKTAWKEHAGGGAKNLGEQVADWEKSIEATKNSPSGKANALLEDIRQQDQNYTSDVEKIAARAAFAEQVKERLSGKFNPYDNPKFSDGRPIGDGYGYMEDDGRHGEPSESLKMLRTSPEIFDSLVDTDDALGAADDLQSFTDEYMKEHPLSSGGSDVTKIPEVKAPRDAKLFYEDYGNSGGSVRAENGGSVAANDDTESAAGTIPDSTAERSFTKEQLEAAANDNLEPKPDVVLDPGSEFGFRPSEDLQNEIWESTDKSWKVKFEREGGEISAMNFDGLAPNTEKIARDVFVDFDTIYSQITADPDASKLFSELSEFKMAYDDLALQDSLFTEQGIFVKMQLIQTMDELQSKFGGVDTDIFKSDLLEKLGLSTRQKAA